MEVVIAPTAPHRAARDAFAKKIKRRNDEIFLLTPPDGTRPGGVFFCFTFATRYAIVGAKFGLCRLGE